MKWSKILYVLMAVSLILGGISPGLSPAIAAPDALTLTSTYASTPPQIDGQIGFGEWNLSNKITFPNGFISVVNDAMRLYVLLDVTGDTGNDRLNSDYFYVTFDVNRDAKITANKDLNYSTEPSTGNMRYQIYLSPHTWTGLQPNTYSSRGKGFGCFWADGTLSFTFFPFRFTCNQHRVWELAFDLAEIGATAGGSARMGVRVASANPAFTNETPANFINDFTNLINVTLAPSPYVFMAPLAGATVVFDSTPGTRPIEITQAVQNRNDTLPLVSDKTTVARVYAMTANVPFPETARVYLYGSTGGVDLPGSPMATFQQAPTVINRSSLSSTANFQLPTTWDQGTVTFQSRAVDFPGNTAASTPFALTFTPKSVPTYWVVPINTGSNTVPVVPSNAEIASQESYLKAIYPLSNVNFVQKPWSVIGPTTVNNTINALNTYYNSVFLAWLLTVIFTGNQPYILPNQIYGLTPTGGGISDPTWVGGNGFVARGFQGTSLEGTMAHEINHNLDRSSNGTWGRHVPNDCGAAGPDPNWPYADSNTNEVGFDTRQPWKVVPNNFPDIMSYCQSGSLPTKWISPYRWTNLFGNFTSAPTIQAPEQITVTHTAVYYVTGQVNRDGTGSLNPLLIQQGMPTPQNKQGAYSVQVLNTSGQVIRNFPFDAQFMDDPEEPVNSVYFNFQIPLPIIITAPNAPNMVRLMHGDQVLDQIVQSPNAPVVSFTSPKGGETWKGMQTLQWTASDADPGTKLSFTLLYSPDLGKTWSPLAANITANSLAVDTSALPGGSQAIFRVIASDGYNNTQADSLPITIANNAPHVAILSPEEGSGTKAGIPVSLSGEANDPEGADIPAINFVWTEGNNVLGTGPEATTNLSLGWHTITLNVSDSSGNTGKASVTVFVGSRIFMVTIRR